MRKVIEQVIFSNESSYKIHVHTGVNQGLIGDIRDGYITIDSMPYIDAERLYQYGLEHKEVVPS
ncbi:hypothetical protein H6Y62_02355 [Staphylococcus lugdunensis]|jgi:hypothetical protein|uniref:Uncharacterized protein n=1 Tax=Staphylococcus lugdunensis TaxID=28035 RepID=A0A133Q633_STALU|nr:MULTISPECIES: hypothetical protein [Staphylococcus]ADC86662.1 hypothetical protein SLGD_00514 [Staphylococcus lugdunensis HKU09-01]AMG62108.1 hypothetical protein AL499_09160 [Staphylococcus lugdunensis]AMG63970.1 hypothetical protein AL501_06855 [Staphylococcus lugdunensis]ARB76970.1 hypothetical protein A6J61_01050 [Staphylococcus lugdunensis]ARJ08403.1 hypothetical protein B7454_03075 [Staphylococcus lugdunensis]